jgi:HSP20 family protein
MKLTRFQPSGDLWHWSPANQWDTLRDEINRLFDPVAGPPRATQFFNVWSPPLDLYEDNDHLLVRVELPGMKKEDIEISLHEGVLSISGERKSEGKYNQAETYRSERFYGRFQRTVALPKGVAADKVKATYQDGILTVTLPKTEEAKPKQIEVKVG